MDGFVSGSSILDCKHFPIPLLALMENYSRDFPLGSSRNATLENRGLTCDEHFPCVTGHRY